MSKTGNMAYDAMYGVVTSGCRACKGEGAVAEILPNDGFMPCADCVGTGEIQCDTPAKCPFDYCYCEAAWDRQQEQYSEDAS